MLHNILEVSKRASKGGRVPIKIALLKIHDDPTETNKNGLHWKREYISNAIESAKMMPICAEFVNDDKDIPLGHGLTGSVINSDGLEEPEFLNSETVGVIEGASIEEVKKDNETFDALVGNGYLYNQRYPKFVSWVRKNFATNEVDTSIEIIGTPENDNKIIYEEETPTDTFRTPKEFLFSGTAILSISPADDSAVVLEVAQKQTEKKEEQNMEFNMDEIKSVIKTTMTEMNSADEAHANEIQKLNDQITELNSQLAEKDSVIAEKDSTIAELNASAAEMQKLLDQMKADQQTYWDERAILEQEIAKAKVAEKLAELDATLGEFNEEEKEVAKEDIETLKQNINACQKKEELNNVTSEINSIKSKICMAIVEKQKADAKEQARIAEQNSHEEKVEDIFSEIFEINAEDEDVEEINIF